MQPAQPYYLIGQWRLSSDRQLRAFVCSQRGTLHLTRVYDDRDEMTSEEASDCDGRIFPDLFRRLEDFDLKFPGLLRGSSRSAEATDVSVGDGAPAQPPGVESSKRFGELLVREQMITHEQLEVALRLQIASPSYVPIGHILLTEKFISRKTLMRMLHRYRKNARLGEVLLKAGRITASQLADGLDYQRRASVPIGQVFMRLGWLSETAMRDALCTQLHINLVDTDLITIDRDLARLVSEPFARRHALVPLLRVKNVVVIAMDDPSQADVIAAIESALGLEIEAVTTLKTKLEAAIDRLYASAGSLEMRPLGGEIIVGPIRDHAVAELLVGASPWATRRRAPASPVLREVSRAADSMPPARPRLVTERQGAKLSLRNRPRRQVPLAAEDTAPRWG